MISEIVAILDVWSYKIRVGICKYSFNSMTLLWFAEKRQSNNDIVNNDIINLENLCDNIYLAIKKAEKQTNTKIEKIVINPIFSDTFFISKYIAHNRKEANKIIDEKELESIISRIEEIWIMWAWKIIESKFLYSLEELDLIITNISSIKIDHKIISSPLWETWENINFNLLNIFISKSNNEIIKYIWNYLNKKIVKILPEEFCLSKIWEKNKEVVIINIWNSSSFITIKDSKWNLVWSTKIWVWIESLINKIIWISELSRTQIIKKIDRDDFYLKEKNTFLEIYSSIILETIKEIIWEKICPKNFFIVWWWWNNSFFKNYFKKIDFNNFWIKINQNIKFIIPDVKKIWKIENIEEILNKSNLNLISMILAYGNIVNHKSDIIEKSLEKTVQNILN